MSNDKQLNDLAYQVELLQENVALLTDAINRTDDFNNWTIADSLANIANALVKANTLEKTRQSADKFKSKAEMKQKIREAEHLLQIGTNYELVYIGPDPEDI